MSRYPGFFLQLIHLTGQEELPYVRGQGQWPRVPGQAATAQERPRGATLCLRSGAAGRSNLAPEARGGDPEEPPQARGKGRQLREAPKEQWVRRHRRA